MLSPVNIFSSKTDDKQSDNVAEQTINNESVPTAQISSADHSSSASDLNFSNTSSTENTMPERISLTDLHSYKPQSTEGGVVNDTDALVDDQESKQNIYTEICTQIIKEQEQIIGALAIEQAQLVEGLTVDPVTFQCKVDGDGSVVIDHLISKYRDFFGHAAVEVCKEAAARFIDRLPADALPASLK